MDQCRSWNIERQNNVKTHSSPEGWARTGAWKKPLVELTAMSMRTFTLTLVLYIGTWLLQALSAPNTDYSPELVAQFGHTAKIQGLVFSPDGKLLVSTGADNSVQIWNVENGRAITQVRAYGVHEGGVAVAPNQSRVAIRAGTDVLILDWFENKIVTSASVGAGRLVKYSPDGALLVTETNGRVQLLNSETLEVELSVEIGEPVTAIAISNSNDVLVVGSSTPGTAEGHLTVRSISSNGGVREVPTGGNTIGAISFDAQAGSFLASGAGVIITARLSDLDHPQVKNVDLSAASNLVVIAPSGRSLATSSLGIISTEHSIRHSTADGELIHRLEGHESPATALAFAPGEKMLASGGWDASIKLWNLATGSLIRTMEHHTAPPPLRALAVTSTAEWLAAGGADMTATLWNLKAGRPAQRTKPHKNWINSLALSEDGRELAAADHQGSVSVYSGLPPAREVRLPGPFDASANDQAKVSYSGVEDAFVYTSTDQIVRVWSPVRREVIFQSEPLVAVSSLAVSPTETVAAIGHGNGVLVWNWATGSREEIALQSAEALAFSPDGTRLAISELQSWDERGELLPVKDRVSKLHVRTLRGSGFQSTVRVGKLSTSLLFVDSTTLLSGDEDGVATVWDSAKLTHRRKPWDAHSRSIAALSLLSGPRVIVSAGEDAAMRFWSTEDYRLLLTIQVAEGGDWLAFTPEGVFDTASLETSKSLAWRMPDDPLDPVPPEIFMRDYYQPNLLGRLLACHEAEASRENSGACREAFKPVRQLAGLNRIQPDIRIVSVKEGPSPDVALVELEAAGKEDKSQSNRKTRTGVYDVRLFRDGQLVGQWPAPPDDGLPADSIPAWRAVSQVSTHDGKASQVFPVQLAARDRNKKITFTAYGFNEDRVKSATATDDSYMVPETLTVPANPRAYVITVGVNKYEDDKLRLNFAVADAKAIGTALQEIQGYRVVPILLASDHAREEGSKEILAIDHATKANIHSVLDLLAGKGEAERSRLQRELGPVVDRIAKATPDDLVILAFSGHGHTKQGRFFLMPSDSGGDLSNLDKLISSEELTAWLREVDAGEMVMIIDACHSAGGVPPGFKPGPMGDRGLGQLAYDKGIRILAATQADDVALESGDLGQGLLTYALVREGLTMGPTGNRNYGADGDSNGSVTMKEWLTYAESRVPGLYQDVLAGKVPTTKDSKPNPELLEDTARHAQTPALFDFGRGTTDVVLRGAQ